MIESMYKQFSHVIRLIHAFEYIKYLYLSKYLYLY